MRILQRYIARELYPLIIDALRASATIGLTWGHQRPFWLISFLILIACSGTLEPRSIPLHTQALSSDHGRHWAVGGMSGSGLTVDG
jgi:hypothetical protein